MSTHCTYCKITWAHLKSIEGDGEEVYEVCPECGSDMHLVETVSDGYIKCEITGEITHVFTGERYERPREPVEITPYKPILEEHYQEKERREDSALNAYFEQGEEAYFNALKKKK